jgi:hypothetical protein
MSKYISRLEYSKIIKKNPNYVGMYIKRHKIIEKARGIDIEDPINIAFMQKHSGNIEPRKPKEVISQVQKEEPKESEQNQNIDRNKISRDNIDYIKSQHDLKLKQLKIEQGKLDVEKKQAKIVPVSFMSDSFNMYMTGNVKSIINNGNIIIERIIDELGGKFETRLKYQKEFKLMILESVEANHARAVKEIIEKAKDYAAQRNW